MLFGLFYDLLTERYAVSVNHLTIATDLVSDVIGNDDVHGLICKRKLPGSPVISELECFSMCRGR